MSHRYSQFVAALFRTLAKSVVINLEYTTADHHQVDGQTERAKQVTVTYLRTYASDNPEEWDEHLALVECVYNSSTHSATATSPCELDLGYTPRMLLDRTLPARTATVSPAAISCGALAQRLQQSLRSARNRLAEAQDVIREQMNRSL